MSSSRSENRRTFDLPEAGQARSLRLPLSRGETTRHGATPWSAPASFGDPPQRFHFMLDTGTPHSWLTDARCATAACDCHQAFSHSKSRTFEPVPGSERTVKFGPWGHMKVRLGRDRLAFGPDPVDVTQALRACLELAVHYDSDAFASLDCDGGLGMPLPSTQGLQDSADPDSQVFHLLTHTLDAGLIESPLAAFDYAMDGQASCLLGAVDPGRFRPGTLNPLPVRPRTDSLDYLWNVAMDDLCCDGRHIHGDGHLALDTGSSRFKGGRAVIEHLVAAITGDGERPTQVDCAEKLASYPDVVIRLGGVDYTLTPEQYFQPVAGTGWVLGCHYLHGLPDGMLVAGTVFLETVYTVFSLDRHEPARSVVWLART